MVSVGDSSVLNAWQDMGRTNLVPTAEGNPHNTLRTIKVSEHNSLPCSLMLCQYWLGKREIQALLVKCSNAECGDTMERQQLRNHVHVKCPHTVIPCKYKGIGCDAELKREDMAAHEQDDKLHLHMALETVNLERKTLKKKNDGSMTCAMPDFDNRRKCDTRFFSTSFYVSPRGYHMSLMVIVNGYGPGEGTHVSVHAPILEGEYDAELKWPFVGEVTYTLLNQLEDSNHHTRTLSIGTTHNAQVGDRWGIPQFIPHSALTEDPVKNTQYLKDDTLYFRVSVQVADYKPWLECTAKN